MSSPPPGSFAFRPAEHLRRPADFRRVYERRRSAADDLLIVYACENGLPYLRLGLSVSRKMGGAVEREGRSRAPLSRKRKTGKWARLCPEPLRAPLPLAV